MPAPKRPRRPPRRLARRPRRPPREPSRWPLFALLLLVPLAFYAGRTTAPAPEVTPPPEPPPEPPALAVSTSTAGLCPCPKPPPPRKPAKPKKLVKKAPPPVVTPDFERADPTKETAAYLKRASRRLAKCAPAHGAQTRVHLEVTVEPSGTITVVHITNVDPVPGAIATCVDREMKALTPPAFDATEPATFGLTVVL